jgi:hypothetical protein
VVATFLTNPLATQGERIVKLITDGRLALLPQSGQIPQFEQADEFRRMLQGILAGR